MGKREKILFCGPIDHPLNSGRYMIDGLRQLGYEVSGFDYRAHGRVEEDLLKIVKGDPPRYVFILRGGKISPDLTRRLKEFGCTTILWFTVVPLEPGMIPLARVQDFVLTNVEDHVDTFQRAGVRRVKWFHQGFAPEFFGIEGPGIGEGGDLYADAAMVGSMGSPIYHQRCKLVMRLRGQGFNIRWWGPRLSRKLKNLPYFWGGVARAWAGKEVYMRDFADVIRHTRIFLGQDSDLPIRGKYLSNRSFAVMGCGGFYLCRRTPGIEFAYEVGREVVVFDTEEEMVDKVRYFLKNEGERKRIALAGQARVLNQYTYKRQLEGIFRWIRQAP